MYSNILIPTDGSGARRECSPARHRLRPEDRHQSHRGDGLAPVSSFTTDTQMIEDTPAHYQTRMRNHAEKTLDAIADAGRTAGVACEIVPVEHEHPYRAVIDTADAKACDLNVMASHGRRGMAAIVLGSETLKVLTRCKTPVLVHR